MPRNDAAVDAGLDAAVDADSHPRAAPATPSLARRMASFLYEGVLLFGVVVIAAYLFGALAQQRHALYLRHGLQGFLFIVLGIYFVWFWTHGGQTVAMKTWRVRLVAADGKPLSQPRALLRYLLCWAWFLPGLALAWLAELRGGAAFGALALNVLLWMLASRLAPQRQFLHDLLAGTRLVDAPPLAGSAAMRSGA
jgi:uncharacterized RDD family membrane protein YckC